MTNLTLTLNLDNNYKLSLYEGCYGKYYSISKNELLDCLIPVFYDIHFPVEWALEEEKNYYNCYNELGPHKCKDCKMEGYINGVFIAYCMDCFSYFDDKRANIDSCKNSYLKNISNDKIGDIQLATEHEIYKDMPDLMSDSEEELEKEEEKEEEKEDCISMDSDNPRYPRTEPYNFVTDYNTDSSEDWAEIYPDM